MLDLLNYIYKYFKLAIFSSLFLLINLIVYIDGYVVHANNIYISDTYLLEQQMKYTRAMYGIDSSSELELNSASEINNLETINIFNTVNYDFNLFIDNLWIDEELFTFPLSYNNEYDYINSKKTDLNMIDFELIDVTDINKGFIIWAHSSWLWTDDSKLKKVFNWLDQLNIWDEINLKRSDGVIIKYNVKVKSIKNIDEKINLSNRYYLYTCYPVGSTDQRLVVELELQI